MNPAGAVMDTAPSGIHPAAHGIHPAGNGIDTVASGTNPEAAISDTVGAGIHTISSGMAVPRLKSGAFCKKTTPGADSDAARGLSGWHAHRHGHRRLHGGAGLRCPCVRGAIRLNATGVTFRRRAVRGWLIAAGVRILVCAALPAAASLLDLA